MQARAPAKAILSGEHAVVYGMPALALALPLYATVRVGLGVDSQQIELLLTDLNHRIILDPPQLLVFQQGCEQRYQSFLEGNRAIDTVLPNPSDLYHYALSMWPDAAASLAGSRIELSSAIAIGSGMGSSAATVLALFTAIAGHTGTILNTESLIELTTRCECLQHGRSSGLDPAICARGGLLQFQQGLVEVLPVQLDTHWYRVDSGRPLGTTGNCTSWVKQHFGGSDIWTEFAAVTRQLADALQHHNVDRILDSLRNNHRLLCRIGVVPEPVQAFIGAIERRGGAAKISGAGAISGDSGGMILVYMPDTGAVADAVADVVVDEVKNIEMASTLGSSWQALEVDRYGAQLRD